jgi:hypothetical protein
VAKSIEQGKEKCVSSSYTVDWPCLGLGALAGLTVGQCMQEDVNLGEQVVLL